MSKLTLLSNNLLSGTKKKSFLAIDFNKCLTFGPKSDLGFTFKSFPVEKLWQIEICMCLETLNI